MISEPTASQIVANFLEKSNSTSKKPTPKRKELMVHVAEKSAFDLHFTLQDIEELPLKNQKHILLSLIKIAKSENLNIK